MSSKDLSGSHSAQYVGPYRLEKTLGKGQTGKKHLNSLHITVSILLNYTKYDRYLKVTGYI